ncbi:LacI family DNA-binding transcriptional regulator [Saccharopolyspora sp. TS4A08]|uniref:LacI family DNA-binding transcriptional regulator n=1 Tax=Saccharopolyspora ipomoeae TaxID=3042027 RepID=A0ABT6PRS8_9PSEU|nr:LacI family DNA-binding transcriptional regulator [Saccharopolyspora sp. TS4A08]MDI2030146.1 LacI family DNA-binding transcriptional regulator [Saccharopolyspora sp. TS4A08]
MATLADVARVAGVSSATVSYVLNGTRKVRPETERAVRAAVEEVGYIQNTLARSLATARTLSIGVAISSASNPYFTEILQGIEAEAVDRGYSLLVADPRDDPDHELRVVSHLHQRRIDGIVLAPSPDPSRTMRYLADHDVPTVLADRVIAGGYDQVSTDNTESTASLVDHLAALGHRRIGFVAGLAGLSTTDERLAGYREGLRRNDIDDDPELCREGSSESEAARRAASELLTGSRPATAIIAANNAMTIGAMRAVRDLSLSVPDDVALVAFDDFPWADLFAPRLTAIAQPSREVGAEALRLLLDRLDDPGRDPVEVRLESRFVHRDSCGCAATA